MIQPMPDPAANRLNRLQVGLKALAQLGPRTMNLYARYQLGLRSGWYRARSGARQVTRARRIVRDDAQLRLASDLFPLPTAVDLSATLGESGRQELLSEAQEILQGRLRLFGAEAVPLQLAPAAPLSHWTVESRRLDSRPDVKLTWEPARFGWAIVLARAYRLSGDERLAAAFWEQAHHFMEANPPYSGPNWVSAQEAALRLIALVFAGQVFAAASQSTPDRLGWLAEVAALHAERLPLTLAYARAQNNNHLLSEAAGLITAGLALPRHPHARRWSHTGWQWFRAACLAQFDRDGAYIQHSASYQRLALHLALWVHCLLSQAGTANNRSNSGVHTEDPIPTVFPADVQRRLSCGARWLLELHDPYTGRLPNLGPNDGALLLPLSVSAVGDYRPVLQAACLAFLGRKPFAAGAWDEALLWLGLQGEAHFEKGAEESARPATTAAGLMEGVQPGGAESLSYASGSQAGAPGGYTPHVLRSPDGQSWAYLRAAHFSSRPGHADQLHLDLWWRGLNLAMDAGTYLYNGQPPWDNPLSGSEYHNTLTVDGRDQMLRLGRFLFLDWCEARVLARQECSLTAEHDGYRQLGLLHRRTVTVTGSGCWHIEDSLLPLPSFRPSAHSACLHWLLPDVEWSVGKTPGSLTLRLETALGRVEISLVGGQSEMQIARAGQLVYGSGQVKPTWGWEAPTYGLKRAALSVRLRQAAVPPMTFSTQFKLPH